MIEHVWRRAIESGAHQVVVATDDVRVEEAARGFGAEVCVTRTDHQSGTDRIAEVADRYAWPEATIVVNLQGDEPTMPPGLVRQVAQALAVHPAASIATLAVPIRDRTELFDASAVKVVADRHGYALYFSRAPVPWHRGSFPGGEGGLPPGVPYWRHLGIYAYRVGFLRRFVTWAPAGIEECEALEQLRALWQGERIHVGLAGEAPGAGVDTPEDLERVRQALMTAPLDG